MVTSATAAKKKQRTRKPRASRRKVKQPKMQKSFTPEIGSRRAASMGVTSDGSIPPFDQLPGEVKRTALEYLIKSTVPKMRPDSTISTEQLQIVAGWANEYQEELEILPESPVRIRYLGIRQLFTELHKLKLVQEHRQRQSNLRQVVAECAGYEALPTTGSPEWPIAPSLLYIGSTLATLAGEQSTVRPAIPLLGAMTVLKYQGILVAGIQPGLSDEQIYASAYGPRHLNYFKKPRRR